MNISAHRGFWKTKNEQNSKAAFTRALEYGFGIETDVRDFNGDLVISHDIPASKTCMKLDEFFALYKTLEASSFLALNIKADGLQEKVKAALQKEDIKNYALFDMSVPDLLRSLEADLHSLIRISEVEADDNLLSRASGIWLDCFYGEAHIIETVETYLELCDKPLFIVSPELHRRDHLKIWADLKMIDQIHKPRLHLCTDYPEAGRDYFES